MTVGPFSFSVPVRSAALPNNEIENGYGYGYGYGS